jgi:hypothetical protein
MTGSARRWNGLAICVAAIGSWIFVAPRTTLRAAAGLPLRIDGGRLSLPRNVIDEAHDGKVRAQGIDCTAG